MEEMSKPIQRDTFIILVLAIVALAIGCYTVFFYESDSADMSVITTTVPSATVVPFTVLAQGKQSGVLEKVNYMITSPEELRLLWKDIKATTTPPKVDFTKQQVLIVFTGKEPHSSIDVAKIEDSTVRTVSISLTKLEGSCTKKPVQTPLYEIVAVPVSSLQLTHTDIIATTTCPS